LVSKHLFWNEFDDFDTGVGVQKAVYRQKNTKKYNFFILQMIEICLKNRLDFILGQHSKVTQGQHLITNY